MKKIISQSFLQAAGVVLYVAIVALILNNGAVIFGNMNSLFGPIAFLLLFVLSVAITATLTVGRSVLMYFENQKKEAVRLFLFTVGWLFAFTFIILSAMAVLK